MMTIKSWLCIVAMFGAFAVFSCDETYEEDESSMMSALAEQNVTATISGYFSYREDTNTCSAPACRGYWVKRVNQAKTQCPDNIVRSECYVANLINQTDLTAEEWLSFLNQKGKGIIYGTMGSKNYNGVNYGVFTVTEAWQAFDAIAPSGTFYNVHDTGIICVKAPCFNLEETKLNTTTRTKISGLQGRLANQAAAYVKRNDIIGAGVNKYSTTTSGGIELSVQQFYYQL